MDIKIENGDIMFDQSGNLITVQGAEEVLQQIIIGTKVTNGSFIYGRDYGINIGDLDFNSDKTVKTLEALINEKLVGNSDAFVKVENIRNDDNKFYAQLTVTYGREEIHREVMISG
ncbi:MAG: DUF2634 domain-containing protein [Ruminococcus sp.]